MPDLLAAELASVVACHTAERTTWQLFPIKVLLLASATQFCGFRSDIWSMTDDRLAQVAGPLTRTLSIAPTFAAAGLERVARDPSASAFRDATTGPIMDTLRNTVQ